MCRSYLAQFGHYHRGEHHRNCPPGKRKKERFESKITIPAALQRQVRLAPAPISPFIAQPLYMLFPRLSSLFLCFYSPYFPSNVQSACDAALDDCIFASFRGLSVHMAVTVLVNKMGGQGEPSEILRGKLGAKRRRRLSFHKDLCFLDAKGRSSRGTPTPTPILFRERQKI